MFSLLRTQAKWVKNNQFLSCLICSVKFDNSKPLMAQTQTYTLLVEQSQEPTFSYNWNRNLD